MRAKRLSVTATADGSDPAAIAAMTSLLERDRFGISEQAQHLLKRLVPAGVEWPGVSKLVLQGMRRIEVGAWNPTVGDRLRRRMGAAMLEQLGKHVRVRPSGLWPSGGGIG